LPRFARIAAGAVAELIDLPIGVSPADRYHPAIADACVPAGQDIAIGALWDGEAFAPAPPPPTPPPIRRIAPLAFRRRLPDATRGAITLAAAAAMAQGSATLQVFLDDLAAARFVDLDDPATVGGVAALQAAGLITPQQATALLAAGTAAEAA
jgi:hypothetical protein